MLKPPDNRDMARGILFILLAASFFGMVDGFSKLLAPTQSVAQIVWARYALGIPMLLCSMPPSQWTSTLRTQHLGLQILRGLTPLGVSVGMVLAVRYLPLAEATAILFAAPFFIVALSWPLLGERVAAVSWIGVFLGFLGVLIVARPGVGELSKYAVFPAMSALIFAFFQIITRRLSALGEKPTTTLAWTLLVGGIATTPFIILDWVPVAPHVWLYMLGLGTVFGISQLTLIRAYTYAPPGALAPFAYWQIVSAAIFGLIAFQDVPDFWTLVGMTIIIATGVFVAKSRNR